MKNSKFIYFPVETKVRELDAKLLLAYEAIQNGFVAVVGDKKMMSKIASLPTGVLFYKDASFLMERRFRDAKKLGYKIAVHDEEGFIQFSWDDYLNSRIKFSTGKDVDLFFCWGDGQGSAIDSVKNEYLPNAKVFTVGHPRIDLLQPALRDYKSEKVSDRKMVLINTKLAAVNHVRGDDGFMKIVAENGMLKTDADVQFRLNQIEYERELLGAYCDLIDELVKNTEIDIVIRPHPSENPNLWKERYANCPNVFVTKEHPVGYWISKCDCIVHTGCTTAVEAFVMDKPPVAFKPIDNKSYDIPLPNNVSIIAKTIPDVLKEVNAILNGELNWLAFKAEKLSVLSASVVCDPKSLAYKFIVAELNKLDLPVSKFGFVEKIKMKALFAVNSLRMAVSRKTLSENKIITKAEVEQTLAGLQRVLGHKDAIKVSRLAPHLFVLYK